MIGKRCLATECHTEELCQTIKAKPSGKVPKIAYIRRKEKQQKTRRKYRRAHAEESKKGGIMLRNTRA